MSFLDLGGEGGIRTHGDRKATVLFESTPIVHSGTSPFSVIGIQLLACGLPMTDNHYRLRSF